jgi:hypothetical protein
MKQVLIIALILSSFTVVFAQSVQEKPITQAEYVKMLYEAEKSAAAKQNLINDLRRRGIAFVLTNGLRSLTTSKSRNDAELKRTLEEAERRRQNPSAAQPPSARSKRSKKCRILLLNSRFSVLTLLPERTIFAI